MNVLFVTSEIVPFSKTGGLADVCGALPKALEALGHDVWVVTPLYASAVESARQAGIDLVRHIVDPIVIPVGEASRSVGVLEAALPHSRVRCLFVDYPDYFDRPGLYVDPRDESDYPDNCERYVTLARGALEIAERFDLRPDIVHCHDWQAGLTPVYIKTLYRQRHTWAQAATVFTIHNIAFQGIFWHWDMKLTGLPWELFNWRMLEYYGKLSFLKAGMVFADVITTVSRKYAEEIQTPEFGAGMENLLRERSEDLYGIINGVDYATWSPDIDQNLPARYSRSDLAGKAACKLRLQEKFGLARNPDVPVIGIVSRLTEQKGFDLIEQAMPRLMQRDLQLVVLGTGMPRYHESLTALQRKHPEKFGLMLAFDNPTAHLIEAGSDLYLMPSRFEPSGLNQLYSLRYGTVPIVRRVGGLCDTIVDYNTETSRAGLATGFTFDAYSADEMLKAVDRALKVFREKKDWDALVGLCMRQDWSWEHSAEQYVQVYRAALEKIGRK